LRVATRPQVRRGAPSWVRAPRGPRRGKRGAHPGRRHRPGLGGRSRRTVSADRVARALFSLLFGAAGYLLAESLFQRGVLTGPNNLLYLTVLGLLLGFLLSAPAARWFASSWNRL